MDVIVMARVRIRMGQCEIEIDSRDFYVDNESMDRIVCELARCLPRAGDSIGGVVGRNNGTAVAKATQEADMYAGGTVAAPVTTEAAQCEMREVSACGSGYCEVPVPVLVQRQTAGRQISSDSPGFDKMQDIEDFEPEFSDDCGSYDGNNNYDNDKCTSSTQADDNHRTDDLGRTGACAPAHSYSQVREGLLSLRDAHGFFDTPRTARDAALRLRDDGWRASSLTVSKILADMALCKQIERNPVDKRGPCTYVLSA